jgi:hypothetical protein
MPDMPNGNGQHDQREQPDKRDEPKKQQPASGETAEDEQLLHEMLQREVSA